MIRFLKKVNFKTLFWVFFYFFLFALLWRTSFNYLDPDLGWHLKVGQEIVSTRAIPHINNYDYSYRGNWVDHEWLSNIGLFLLYRQGGYLAVSAVFVLIIIVVLVLLNIGTHYFWPDISPWPIALFQFLGIVAALPHFGVRVQELGLLYLLLLLLLIAWYNKRPDWRILLFLPPFMYLWACSHASFLIGFFLLSAWCGVKIVERIGQKWYLRPWLDYSRVLKSSAIINFIMAVAVSFAFTLLTPYRLELYSSLQGYENTYYQSHIQEWLSQFSFPLQYWQLVYLALVVLALIVYIYCARQPRSCLKIDLWTLFLVILFVILSFKSRRHFPLMFTATFFFLVEIWRTIFPAGSFPLWPLRSKRWQVAPWLKFCFLFCLLLVGVSQIIQTRFTSTPFTAFCQNYPCGAVAYLKGHSEDDALRILNEYDWGGYLIWTYPSRKLFIDGRLPQIAFAGHSFLEEYYSFFSQERKLVREKLAAYQIGLVLLPATDKNLNLQNWEKWFFNIKNSELTTHNYLRDYLASSPNWQAVYRDQLAVIYKRKQ